MSAAVECQAGGHPGAFVAEAGGRLKKKTGKAEGVFYAQTLPTKEGLAALCPKCYGVEEEGDGEYTVWLEDLCHGFTKPSVADIKMGRTSVGDDNSEERKKRRREAEATTTMGELGVRFTGMVVYQPYLHTHTKYGKEWGYSLQKADFDPSLLLFFHHSDPHVTSSLLLSAVRQVEAILTWFSSQHTLQFFSSSLLFVFDGANPTELRVKMIDFAHVLPLHGGEEERDENYLFGLRELLSRLRSLSLSFPL